MSHTFTYLRITGPRAEDWKFVSAEFQVDPLDEELASKEQLPFFQKAVEGYIEYVNLVGGISAVINEEGKLKELPPTAAWVRDGKVLDILVGNILVVRDGPNGTTVPLLESDIPTVKRFLRPVAK